MNQKQLEAAIRRVSNDPTLEPQVGAGFVSPIGAWLFITDRSSSPSQQQLAMLRRFTRAKHCQSIM